MIRMLDIFVRRYIVVVREGSIMGFGVLIIFDFIVLGGGYIGFYFIIVYY